MKRTKNRDATTSPKPNPKPKERHPALPALTENEKYIRDYWQQRHNGPVTKDKGDEVEAEKSMEL